MPRNREEVKALGRRTVYSKTYNPGVLETFENQHQDNDYWVRFNCPESPPCAPSPVSRTLPRFVSAMFRIRKW